MKLLSKMEKWSRRRKLAKVFLIKTSMRRNPFTLLASKTARNTSGKLAGNQSVRNTSGKSARNTFGKLARNQPVRNTSGKSARKR